MPKRYNLFSRMWVVHIVTIAFLLTFKTSGASTSEPAVVHETFQDQICLELIALTEAINNPTDFNLDILSAALPEQNREAIVERIRNIKETHWQAKDSTYRIAFESISITDKRGYQVTARLSVEIGSLAVERNLVVEFQQGILCPVFSNIDEVLDELEPFMEQSARDLEPFTVKARPVTKVAGERTTLSNNLLTPRFLYESYTRLTSSVSYSEFGHNIFNGTYGLISVLYDDPWNWLDHEFLFILDPNWNRIIGSSRNPGRPEEQHWLQAIGSYGTGTLNFNYPTGIAYVAQRWFIADGGNKRVMSYSLNWNTGDLDYIETISNNFGFVSDVAAARIPAADPINDRFEVAILDYDNSKIEIYDMYGNYQRTLPSYGSNPTSVCYARNQITHYPMDYIYVVYNTEKRVVLMKTNGLGVPSMTPAGMFPSDAQLTSVATDAYDCVYVLDNYNCVVYVLSPNLSEVVATFGTGAGTANDQLYWPNRFEVAEGWAYAADRNVPIVLGDVFVTELYGSNSGVRRSVLGCDVFEHIMSYYPQYTPGYGDRVKVEWDQSNTSESWREVWCNGSKLDDVYNPVNLPGHHYHVYWLEPGDPDSTWYKFVIRVKSKYGSHTDTTFIDSIYVERYVYPGPHIMVDSKGTLDPAGEIPSYCGVYTDTSKWWAMWIDAYDNWNDSDLTYYWSIAEGGLLLQEDTLTYFPWTFFVNTQDTMWFKVTSNGGVNGGWTSLFKILFSTDDYDSTIGYWEYDWIDSTTVYSNRYWAQCDMSCTPDCLLCGDMTGNGSVDIEDLVYLVDYMFGSPLGPAPDPMWIANVDGSSDGQVDIADLVYLVNWMYGSPPGPEPACIGEVRATSDLTKGWTLDQINEYIEDTQSGQPDDGNLPDGFEFRLNYPNPFNPNTTFSFYLPHGDHVSLEIFNNVWQKVTSLTDRYFNPGEHTVEWDGNDENGSQFTNRIFYARLKTETFTSTRKVVIK